MNCDMYSSRLLCCTPRPLEMMISKFLFPYHLVLVMQVVCTLFLLFMGYSYGLSFFSTVLDLGNEP